jgi:hypothetical protein
MKALNDSKVSYKEQLMDFTSKTFSIDSSLSSAESKILNSKECQNAASDGITLFGKAFGLKNSVKTKSADNVTIKKPNKKPILNVDELLAIARKASETRVDSDANLPNKYNPSEVIVKALNKKKSTFQNSSQDSSNQVALLNPSSTVFFC